jgi:hypothetical protein
LLHETLQHGLVVFGTAPQAALYIPGKPWKQKRLHRIKTSVKVDRTQQRFKRICQYALAVPAVAHQFSVTEKKVFTKRNLLGL